MKRHYMYIGICVKILWKKMEKINSEAIVYVREKRRNGV
jgi:hypothetical protein